MTLNSILHLPKDFGIPERVPLSEALAFIALWAVVGVTVGVWLVR
jgi:hypothetical protein